MAISSYMLTPTIDPRQETARKKIAYALMMQGSSGEPIQHWAQGLSRMGQAALGGYELYREDQEDKSREAQIAKALDNFPGMSAPQPPQPSPAQPNRMVAALGGVPPMASQPAPMGDIPPSTAQRPEVMPTDKVWGDKEAEAAGLYEPQKPAMAPPQRMAQAPPPTAQPTIKPPVIPPEAQAEIKALWQNPATRAIALQKLDQYSKPKDQVVPLTDPRERAAYGIGPQDTTPYQKDSTGKISPINPQPFQVNVNQQQESEFRKAAGKAQAERYDKLAQGGLEAQSMVSDLSALKEIGSRISTGKTAEITAALGPYAEAVGVKVEGLDDLQAYKSIVAKLAPRMRVVGSGATSDYEMRQFLEALPGLGKTPGGNEMISNTLNALQQHKIKAAEIASQALSGEIKQSEAEKMLRELPDPLELWKKQGKALKSGDDGWQDMGGGVRIRERK